MCVCARVCAHITYYTRKSLEQCVVCVYNVNRYVFSLHVVDEVVVRVDKKTSHIPRLAGLVRYAHQLRLCGRGRENDPNLSDTKSLLV